MSHFFVMVVGKDVDDQLAPFNENIRVDRYDEGPLESDDIQRFVKHYQNEYPELYSKNFEEIYELFGDDWNGGDWQKDSQGQWRVTSTWNPDAKWDWYIVGGRWTGAFKAKPNVEGQLGMAGLLTEPAKEGWYDVLHKRDIDVEGTEDFIPFALLVHGTWYERATMGWFGMTANETPDEEWKRIFMELWDQIDDNELITAVDCHI